MKYAQKSFTSPVGSDAYRANFDRIFRNKCGVCGASVRLDEGQGLANAHAVVCSMHCAGRYNELHNTNYAFGPNR